MQSILGKLDTLIAIQEKKMRIELFGDSAIDSQVIAKHVRGGSRAAYPIMGTAAGNRSEERHLLNLSADQLSNARHGEAHERKAANGFK